MVIFWTLFSAFFFNHTINHAFFEARFKTPIAWNTLGSFAIALKPSIDQAGLPVRRPGHGNGIRWYIRFEKAQT
jgi:hypothetical protein